jgi:hypothetical protein
MQQNHLVLAGAASILLALASGSYAADTPAETPANPTPAAELSSPDGAVNPQPQETAATPIEAKVSTTPSEQVAADPCANEPDSKAIDCEKLKRRTATEKSSPASSMAPCSSHMDAKGNVIYDDPTCPSRIRPVVSNPSSIYLIRENPFFGRHIDKALGHAHAAEMAGNEGQAIELLDHAQMALVQAKEAQRAGNVPGLNEGIISLTEALRLPEGSSVRDATAYVRDARKNLTQAAGTKYVEIQPQGVVAVSTTR